MAIIKEYYIGKTLIRVDDTYCKDKTYEETVAISKRCMDIYREFYVSEELKRRRELLDQKRKELEESSDNTGVNDATTE